MSIKETTGDGGATAARLGEEAAGTVSEVGFWAAFPVWLRIGLLSFGGPAAQIALMHRVLVDEKRWMADRQFLSALNFCMLLPGPEAMQLATYAGWRMHGIAGGLAAGLSFVLPGAALMVVLATLYGFYGQLPAMETLFLGVKAAVLGIVLQALFRVSKKALKSSMHWALAALSFVALFLFHVPFPIVVLASALIGAMAGARFAGAAPEAAVSGGLQGDARGGFGTLVTIAVWLAVWLGPIAALWLALGGDHVLVQLGVFFSKLAVVSFGGAYAALAYMAQEVVQSYRWLSAGEMVDGLGLAETTLGPLILVTEFVGFIAAFREGGMSWWMGLAGAAVTVWATFAPCFLFIFAGAPYVERLQRVEALRAALAAVTAAVVGVILNLSIWFGLKVLFGGFVPFEAGPLRVDVPMLETLDWRAAVLAAIAAGALFIGRAGVMVTLAICAVLAFALRAVA